MKIREAFKDPNFSNFTKEVVKVGEAVEALGYKLKAENYSQGVQGLSFSKRRFIITVVIEEG